jgi:hypothetical protein
MKLKQLMIIKAIVCIAFGIPMVLIPAKLMSLYGLSLDSNGIVMARLYGGALFGNFILTWFCRNDAGSISLRAAILYLFIYDGINFIVTLAATVTGIMSLVGISAVGIYLFFTIGYGYFQLVKRPAG